MHQVARKRVPATATGAACTHRSHDRARPPLERLSDTHVLPLTQEQARRAQQQSVDLLTLRHDIHMCLDHLFTCPCADPVSAGNAFETLAHPELFSAVFAALDVVPATSCCKRLPSFPQPPSRPSLPLRREKV